MADLRKHIRVRPDVALVLLKLTRVGHGGQLIHRKSLCLDAFRAQELREAVYSPSGLRPCEESARITLLGITRGSL
jgi:hypothetical protein